MVSHTFFSVDVETSALQPDAGYLLTVGIVPVVQDASGKWRLDGREFYVRVDQPNALSTSDGRWSSLGWWAEQNEYVRGEAFSPHLVRHNELTAARMIDEFVRDIEPRADKRFFVANPVSFDKPWIDQLFFNAGMELPFHYRSLCLRSMRYGLAVSDEFGSSRMTESLVPHHALHDAKAQARDLIAMLEEKQCRK